MSGFKLQPWQRRTARPGLHQVIKTFDLKLGTFDTYIRDKFKSNIKAREQK